MDYKKEKGIKMVVWDRSGPIYYLEDAGVYIYGNVGLHLPGL